MWWHVPVVPYLGGRAKEVQASLIRIDLEPKKKKKETLALRNR